MDKYKNVINFIFELGQLKRQHHSGWALAGVKHSETIADHVWRASQIGFILAMLEKADPYKTAMIVLIHDNAETRIGDHHKVTARYINTQKAEMRAFREQVSTLPRNIQVELESMFDLFEVGSTKEAIVAKDADWLEMAFEARELQEQGYVKVKNWIDNIEKALVTTTAKKMIQEMKKKSFCDWWKNLKKMTYNKLYK